MKRILSFLILLSVVSAFADPPDVTFRERLGKATAESFKWFASGTVPGTLGVVVDTLIGDTNKNDTTVGVDIAGAAGISVTITANEKSANTTNVLGTCTFQVADSNGTAAEWHTLPSSTWSASASAADTTFVLVLNAAYPDTVFTAQTGMTALKHGEQAYVRNSRFLRLIWDPTCYAGDTNLVKARITKIYPR